MTIVTVLVLVLTSIGSLDHKRPVQPHQDDGYVDLDSGWDGDSGVQRRKLRSGRNLCPRCRSSGETPSLPHRLWLYKLVLEVHMIVS